MCIKKSICSDMYVHKQPINVCSPVYRTLMIVMNDILLCKTLFSYRLYLNIIIC